jgi:Tol biopolymer transport system component/tRNA A-37 threonylcarbamoyl transferase component Bud32
MTIEAGSRLGPYEILSPLGAGGMGEVYRARDTRLGREVAVKVLPQSMAASPELRQRLEREAKTISQLSHPHICTLHDVGHQDGTDYLVMELLEGETLADRLGKGGALPVEQAVKFGIEIAGALDAAHKAGIVHRDLKPGNIMLTKSGVKLLDFGLAKLHVPPAQAVSAVTSLPTALQESQPLTTHGTILGTFQYMSPEQLEGREADARSDLFAFGCVLYEMLTGRKAFSGKSQASLIGSIMNSEPASISSIQPMVPPALDRVVKGCLAKEPEERWHTAHDVMMQLQWIAEGGSAAGVPAPVAARRKSREKIAWGVAAAALVAALGLGFGFWKRAPKAARLVRFEVATPEEITAIDTPRISPDGRYLAFNATDAGGKSRIWVRPLSALTAQPLAGTEGTTRPFWSPDSRFLGFVAEGKLKKVDVAGGPPQKICDAPTGSDGTWSEKGVILYDGQSNDPIYRVSAAGGIPVVAVKADPARKETSVAWPEFLPDGRHFLYMATGQKPEDNAYRIGTLDSKETRAVASAQTLVTYAPPGYLLFVRDKTLVAQPFDAKSGKTTGEPVPLAEHIGTNSVGLARFSVARDGTLAYRTGESGDRLILVDRGGKEQEAIGDPGEYHNPVFSPSGDRLAFDLSDPRSGKADIWVRDLSRGVSSRFTFGKGDAYCPVWSPDAKRIAYSVDREGSSDIYEKAADGQGEERLLLKSEEPKVVCDWSRDGRYILFMSQGKETGWDIWSLPTAGDGKPVPVVKTPFVELIPSLSPDGRFVAYSSNESGRQEIYVQGFPGAAGKWQISTAGGSDAHWRSDGKELYYRAPDQKIMAVEIRPDGGFQAGVPRAIFAGRFESGIARSKYQPTADGQRFLLVAPLGRESMTPTTVVLNWSADLGR